MKRPGPVGTTILLTFAIVAVIEFRTVLAMVGIEVPTGPYFLASTVIVVAALAALYLFSEQQPGNPTKA
jgi:uncharacterized membrane protein